jgi:hypothetical protein
MLHVAALIGGGILPTHGSYTAAVWAKWVGKSVDYVEDLFAELNVEYERFGGDLRFYDAQAVRLLLPRMTAETDPKRRHGGKR